VELLIFVHNSRENKVTFKIGNIESNVEMPPRSRKGGKWLDMAAKMKHGDSVVISGEKAAVYIRMRALRNAIIKCGFSCVTRTVETRDTGEVSLRVWKQRGKK
jgi:hypothetical protein